MPFYFCKPFSCKVSPGNHKPTCPAKNSNPPSGRDWAGQVRAQLGGSGRGRASLCTHGQTFRFDLQTPWAIVLDVSSEARTYQFPCKPDQGSRRAVDPQDHGRFSLRGTTAALRSWLLTNGPAPFCPCKSFPCGAHPGTKQTKLCRALYDDRNLETWMPRHCHCWIEAAKNYNHRDAWEIKKPDTRRAGSSFA